MPAQVDETGASRKVAGRRKTVLAVVIGVSVSVVGLLVMIVGFALVYGFSAQELEITKEVEASVLTIDDAAEWFELDIKPELEEWSTDLYFDRSAQVYYYYNDEEESIYLNCNLTYEPKRSDALMSYQIEWGGLKLTNRIGPGEPITLEERSEMFQWGDASRFAFQLYEEERYGMAFVTRKGGKVFFLDCWGMVLEDEGEIAGFLEPHLEALERATFRKKPKEEEAPIDSESNSEDDTSGDRGDDATAPSK